MNRQLTKYLLPRPIITTPQTQQPTRYYACKFNHMRRAVLIMFNSICSCYGLGHGIATEAIMAEYSRADVPASDMFDKLHNYLNTAEHLIHPQAERSARPFMRIAREYLSRAAKYYYKHREEIDRYPLKVKYDAGAFTRVYKIFENNGAKFPSYDDGPEYSEPDWSDYENDEYQASPEEEAKMQSQLDEIIAMIPDGGFPDDLDF